MVTGGFIFQVAAGWRFPGITTNYITKQPTKSRRQFRFAYWCEQNARAAEWVTNTLKKLARECIFAQGREAIH